MMMSFQRNKAEASMFMASHKIVLLLGIASLLVAFATNEIPVFGYTGSIGPKYWGSLSQAWKFCSDGNHQSPIDIVKHDLVFDRSLKTLERDYSDANATLINNGFSVEVKYDEVVGNLEIDGKNYSLLQTHWHSPAEHTINGQRFPFEQHLVHKSQDGQIAVIAILYRFGHVDPFLTQLKDKLKDLAKDSQKENVKGSIPVGTIDNRSLRRATLKYYRYVGSLTTPPCSESVIWTVLGKVREMTQEQGNALKAPLDLDYRNNARPIQSLNGRVVKAYRKSYSF